MSVFKSLKGTFQNVQQDIVDGFRALTSLDTTPRHEKFKQLRAEGISLDGGADLLYRYQKNWSELQNYTAESAKRAEEVDDMIGDLFQQQEHQWQCVCRLEEEVLTLPSLVSTMDTMIQLVGSLQNDFKSVEEELDKLLNVCEEEEMEREKQSHHLQLAQYRKKKEAEAHAVKNKLWKMVSDRAKEMEARKFHSVKERQQALMEAFSSDMEYYRTHGRPDRLSSTEFPKVSSLSEMTIEEDKNALDEFLSSGEHSDHAEGEGGAFIEDDYTTDYTNRPRGYSELDDDRPIDFDSDPQGLSDGIHIVNLNEQPKADTSGSSKLEDVDNNKEKKNNENETVQANNGESSLPLEAVHNEEYTEDKTADANSNA